MSKAIVTLLLLLSGVVAAGLAWAADAKPEPKHAKTEKSEPVQVPPVLLTEQHAACAT